VFVSGSTVIVIKVTKNSNASFQLGNHLGAGLKNIHRTTRRDLRDASRCGMRWQQGFEGRDTGGHASGIQFRLCDTDRKSRVLFPSFLNLG